MIGPFVRIALRYLSGVLVARGLFSADDASVFADPELASATEAALGVALGAAAEGWYYLARRFGWSK